MYQLSGSRSAGIASGSGCARLVSGIVPALLVTSLFWSGSVLGQQVSFDDLVERDWLHVQSKNLDVISDLGDKSAQRLVEQLEEFASFCQLILKPVNPGVSKRATLFVAAKNSTWVDLGQDKMLVSFRSDSTQHPTAVVNLVSELAGRSKRAVAVRTDLFKVIAWRELEAAKYGQALPLWYRNGMSLYMSTFDENKGRILVGGTESLDDSMIAVIKAGGGVNGYQSEALMQRSEPLQANLFADSAEYLAALEQFNAQAFMTAHFFQSSLEYRERGARFLQMLELGDSAEAALSKAFGWTFAELDQELQKYSSERLFARAFDKNKVFKLIEQKNGPLLQDLKMEPMASDVALMHYVKLFSMFDFNQISDPDKNLFAKRVISSLQERGITAELNSSEKSQGN